MQQNGAYPRARFDGGALERMLRHVRIIVDGAASHTRRQLNGAPGWQCPVGGRPSHTRTADRKAPVWACDAAKCGPMTPGPRSYRSAVEKALFDAATGTCYFPGCAEPTIVFVEGHPVTNVDIAHIRGAQPGSARYDPSMSNAQRASFGNLILLCRPHHQLVDRVEADKYGVDVLQAWKAARRRGICGRPQQTGRAVLGAT